MPILDLIETSVWGIEEASLAQIRAIAAREHTVTPEALEAYRAGSLARAERAKRRGDTAIVYLEGPIFRRANMMTEISGATSLEVARQDFQVALDDPTIRRVVLSLDSPGGEVTGVSEFAQAIFDARGKKPVTAYVGGSASSAAYWLAAAADEIVMADTGSVGSIGVVLGIRDTRERDAKSGVKTIEFVSSASPNKRPDVMTDEGRASVQRIVDDLAAVFIGAVAKYRGVSEKDVLTKFGQGGIEIGKKAVSLGMADRIGTFESVLSMPPSANRRSLSSPIGVKTMGTTTATADEGPAITQESVDAAVAQAVAAARKEASAGAQARVAAILTADESASLKTLAIQLAFTTEMSAEDAKLVLTAAAADAPKAMELMPFAAGVAGVSFADHKAGLGAAEPVSPKPEAYKSGRSKAAAAANQRLGAA